MSPLLSLLSRYTKRSPRHRGTRPDRPRRRLTLERLEDRTVPTAVAPPSGLISWWTADNTAADLTTRHHGTLVDGAAFAAGKVGPTFNLDGLNDYVSVPYHADFNFAPTGQFSIES